MMKLRIIIIGIVLVSFFGALVYGILNNNITQDENKIMSNGVVDLSKWNFEQDGIVKLNNQWEIYFNQFISPHTFEQNMQGAPSYIELPGNNIDFNNIKPFKENYFYITLRTKVKISDPSQIMALKTTLILSSYKIFVDGKELGEIGKVGTSKENSSPRYNNLVTFFKPVDEEVEIIIYASDFYLGDCLIGVPHIGIADQIVNENRLALGKDLFVFGILFIISIYHLGLYIKRKNDKSPLFFSFFCILVAIRTLLVGERFIVTLMPLPHDLYSRLAYLTAYMSMFALAGFLYYTLEGLFSKKYYTITKNISFVFAGTSLLLNYHYYNMASIPFTVFVFIFLAYSLIKLVKGYIKKWEYADHVLFGFMFFGVAIANDIIYQFVLINKGSMVPFGVAAFALSQAFTLATKFSKAFSTAEKLTGEKEQILLDIKNSNACLEQRVNERTKELTSTLDELEAMSKTDYLTKLYNRRYMYEIMAFKIKNNKRFYIAIGDIDNFKIINDTYGHSVGDELLLQLAKIFKETLKGIGVASRWGGEEFLFIIEEEDKDQVTCLMEQLRTIIENTNIFVEDKSIQVTMTFGICMYTEGMNVEHCISIADEAMYKGKNSGKNKAVVC
ncbi:MAG: diguanylate cyclase [Firmicutes bacterium HGW-Firmicutes-7]|nr:MAG: diguanylate cyclase [Firmicutes bacterium HGW-Firmicutes-7]